MTEPTEAPPDAVEVSVVRSMDITSETGRGSSPENGLAVAHSMELSDGDGDGYEHG